MTGHASFSPGEPLMLTLCLEEDSILVSKAILETLEHPKQVQMLINEERQMLLLQACTVDDREAVVIPVDALTQFEMSGHALLKRIRKLTGWTDSLPRVSYLICIQHSSLLYRSRWINQAENPAEEE